MSTLALRLHERCYQLLTELGDVGVLGSDTIEQRHFGDDTTGRSRRRRLHQLTQAGLLMASPHPLSFGAGRGGRPRLVYGLTPFGAETVYQHTGVLPRRLLRGDPLKPDTLLHRLQVAAVQLAITDACRNAGKPQKPGLPKPVFILEQDTNPDANPEGPFTERFVLYELFKPTPTSSISCRPDASCFLQIPAESAQPQPPWLNLLLYFEIDRATVTLARIARMIEGHRLLFTTGTYRKHWPGVANPVVKVVFVVPSAERLRNIAATIRSQPGSDLFRLTTMAALNPATLLTELIWHTPTGELRRLWTKPTAPSPV